MTIVPRWEWRTFGADFGDAEAQLTALPRDRVEDTEEIYMLSAAGDASVKVRAQVMDIKHLQQTNADGLEQWLPVMKAPLPLSPADSAALSEALGPNVRTVEVSKHREHYVLARCMAEISELRTAQGTTRTLAVEAEDPELVIGTVRRLGLADRENTCMARGLKALVGYDARRYATIDIGTNSVKFHLGERGEDGGWSTIDDRAEVTRLGQGADDAGRLAPAPIARTVEAVAGMASDATARGAVAIAAVGTAGLRAAPNAAELIDAVRARCGLDVEAISGEEEARLAYVGAVAELALPAGAVVVFDTGGGSSQFTFGRDGRVDERFSLPVGAARLTERYGLDGAVSGEALAQVLSAIAGELASLGGRPVPDAIVGMGGAVTNLAAIEHTLAAYDPDVVQGTVLDRAAIDRQIERFRACSADERRSIVGLQPARAEVILAGACIVRTVLELLGRDSLTVSDRGLRHGLLRERFAA